MKDWRGILKILEIRHIRGGEVIWEDHDILNLLHTEGEQFLLTCCFDNNGSIVPANYYFGLDSRSSLATGDTMSTVASAEPSGSGYSRQTISSNGGFAIQQVGSYYRAVGSIVTFSATGAYGPIRNLFLTDQSDNSGYLISSAELSSPVTFANGDSVALRMSLQLRNGP